MDLFPRACALLCIVVSSGCHPEVTFEVPIEGEATLEGGGLLGALLERMSFGSFANLDFSSTQAFENQQAEKHRVTEARLLSAALVVTDPDGQDFDFIEQLTFSASAPDVPAVEVASAEVPRNVERFELETRDVDLAAHVRADRMSVTTEVRGRRPTEDTTVRAELIFRITAGL